MKLIDAHCHPTHQLSDRLPAVINGTSPDDWDAVSNVQNGAIGLHPWEVNDAHEGWQARFIDLLPSVMAVGEIGLDGLCDVNIDLQIDVFRWQLKQAARNNLPVSIHCLKASEPLLSILEESERPKRGIHLHAYNGSAQQITQFIELGAYFSFHAGQFLGKAKKARQAIQAVPSDRLLIETDAPNSLKKEENHEDYLRRGYELAAELRAESLESIAEQVGDNFERYFLKN
ncbi:TatD family hydrolase [Puniceicoccaceae bacterium]|nr:TatD family hydrolase [Puniceicoccaceae bacterium]